MEAMCKQIHHQLTKEFKYALVWGLSAKHSPQRVGLTHQLADEDVVQVRVWHTYIGEGPRQRLAGRGWGWLGLLPACCMCALQVCTQSMQALMNVCV